MTVHKAKRAGIAVKDSERVPERICTGIVRPTVNIVVDATGGVVYLFDKEQLLSRIREISQLFRILTPGCLEIIRQRIAAEQQMLQVLLIKFV